MNSTTLKGEAQGLGGTIKEAAGKLVGDSSLQRSGRVDQVVGDAKQVAGSAIDAVTHPGSLIDSLRGFARERPYTTAALIGVLGLATINTLRGK